MANSEQDSIKEIENKITTTDPIQLRMWAINQICENAIWRDRMPQKEFTNALIGAAIKIEHFVLTGEAV